MRCNMIGTKRKTALRGAGIVAPMCGLIGMNDHQAGADQSVAPKMRADQYVK
jgi:hypothetical protein